MKNFIFVLLALFSAAYMEADTIYVQQDFVGAGSSWENAMGDINAAIAAASTGDQIWVAKGVYKPGATRSSSFSLKGQVKMYGGFSGSETDVASRSDYGNGGANQTILSGNIGNLDSISDNVYTVVVMQDGNGLLADNLLDGFVIADGNGDDVTDGVGLYSTNGAKLLVNKCVIKDCVNGNEGGASYIINGAVVVFNEGEIKNCSALLSGGASMTVSGGRFDCINSLVEENSITASGGAGGAFYTTNGGLLNIINSELYSNTATGGNGGALYAQYADLYVSNCHFANNYADFGGAMFFIGGAPDVNNCIIANNEASTNGGGMYIGQWTRTSGTYVYTSDPTFANNTIVNNAIVNNESQSGKGGGIYVEKTSAIYFINNIFSGNDSSEISLSSYGLNLAYSYVKGGESGIDFGGNTITYPGGTYGSTNAEGVLTFVDSTTSTGNNPTAPSYDVADWGVLSGSVNIDAGSPTVDSCGVAVYPSLCMQGDTNLVRYNAEHVSLLPNVCIDGKDRVDGPIDMGAFEFEHIPTGLQKNAITEERFVYAFSKELFFDLDGTYTVEVYNLQGQLMIQKRLEGKSQFAVEELSGIYLVRANSSEGVKSGKVFVR